MCACKHAQTRGQQQDPKEHSQKGHDASPLRQRLSLTASCQLGKATRPVSRTGSSASASPAWQASIHTAPGVFMWMLGSNVGPCACKASTLLTEPFLQLLECHLSLCNNLPPRVWRNASNPGVTCCWSNNLRNQGRSESCRTRGWLCNTSRAGGGTPGIHCVM